MMDLLDVLDRWDPELIDQDQSEPPVDWREIESVEAQEARYETEPVDA